MHKKIIKKKLNKINYLKLKKIFSEVFPEDDRPIVIQSGLWSFVRMLDCSVQDSAKYILDFIFDFFNDERTILMPSFAGGGAEKVGVNLANYFSNYGYSVDLLLLKSYGPYRDQVSPNVNIIDLNVTKTRYAIFKLRTYLKSNLNIKIISVYRDTNIVLGLSAFGIKNNNL